MAQNIGKTRDLDLFLGLYKSTKAPQLRDFLKALYDRSPAAFSQLSPGSPVMAEASGTMKGRRGRPKGSKNRRKQPENRAQPASDF